MDALASAVLRIFHVHTRDSPTRQFNLIRKAADAEHLAGCTARVDS